jgi:hypothetical protein
VLVPSAIVQRLGQLRVLAVFTQPGSFADQCALSASGAPATSERPRSVRSPPSEVNVDYIQEPVRIVAGFPESSLILCRGMSKHYRPRKIDEAQAPSVGGDPLAMQVILFDTPPEPARIAQRAPVRAKLVD